MRKNNIVTVQIVLFSLMLLLLTTNCEEMINEAFSKDITYEEKIIDEQEVNTSGQTNTYEITNNSNLKSSASGLGKIYCQYYPINPDNIDLFMNILMGGGGTFTASFRNNLDSDKTLSIFLSGTGGLDNPGTSAAASLYGTVTIPASSIKILDGIEDFNESAVEILSNLLSFYLNNLDINTLFIYLTASPQPVDITIETMSLVLDSGYLISQTIYPSDDYSQYQDNIDEIKDITINGTIINNGTAPVTMKFFAHAQSQPLQLIKKIVINTGEKLVIEDINGFFTDEQVNTLKNIFNYLFEPGEPIIIDVLFLSCKTILLSIEGISLASTVSVSL